MESGFLDHPFLQSHDPIAWAPATLPADPVVDALNGILQLAAARPAMSSAMFVDNIRGAIAEHLRRRRALAETLLPERRLGLTGWQERRAKEYLTAHAGEDAPIAEAAAACKLSYSYFIKAFKVTTGQTPHRWLSAHRIELAKELLHGPKSIVDIALICGFADQSHLTRVFVRLVGTPPGSWRRQNRGAAAVDLLDRDVRPLSQHGRRSDGLSSPAQRRATT
jgi:AraC family transcriptional regulator